MGSANAAHTGENGSQRRPSASEHKQTHILVFDPVEHDLSFVKEEGLDGKPAHLTRLTIANYLRRVYRLASGSSQMA